MKNISKENYTKNRVYGIVGMVALFLVGAVFGFIINGADRPNNSVMTKSQCNELSERIISAARNNQPDLIAQLNKVFSENCNGRNFNDVPQKPQPKPEVKAKKLPDVTCEAIEKLLKDELGDENSLHLQVHQYNADIYNKLAKNGCAKNKEMYQKMAKRESEIAAALNDSFVVNANDTTCEQIESLLHERLNDCDLDESKCRVNRAQIYANMSERGCVQNSEKYKDLAKQELEIARALTDDSIRYSDEQQEAIKMVETYKRLQMQAEAAKMIEKAKKLTNPAIDFIIQLEKIIEE